LSLISGVGPATTKKLVAFFGLDNISRVYSSRSYELRKSGISESLSQKIIDGLNNFDVLEKEVLLADSNNIKIVTMVDDDYPQVLRSVHVPPVVLYVKGELVWKERNALAFVGARKAGYYAQRVLHKIIPDCINNGFAIVSGGALGADSMAHVEAIEQGGKTVAVLGSGLLCLYPARNRPLFNQIVESGGALVSSFPLEAQPIAENFPARNRIISGLSLGTIVVQAAEKSGALITAYYALDQGREVFAVPGCVDDILSAGCHKLIQKGAKLVNSSADIFDELCNVCNLNKDCGSDEVNIDKVEIDDCTDFERNLLDYCVIPRSVDDISSDLKKDVNDIHIVLFDLQIKGKVEQDFSGMWQKK